jgi:hypothetical protein
VVEFVLAFGEAGEGGEGDDFFQVRAGDDPEATPVLFVAGFFSGLLAALTFFAAARRPVREREG